MQKSYLTLVFLFLSFHTAKAQSNIPSQSSLPANVCFEYNSSLGIFSSASSFSKNQSGSIYVTDTENNEIYKLDADGNVSEFAGGYGWNPGSFDFPAGLQATMLNVYVADKNNHRVQVFDKDLNYLYLLNGKDTRYNSEAEFEYPVSVAVNVSGDFFILESGNKRILKFDSRGNFLFEFGGYRSGSFQLKNPANIISYNDLILCVDDSSIVVFDQYGAGLRKVNMGFVPAGIQQCEGYFTVYNSANITVTDFRKSKFGCLLKKDGTPTDNAGIISAIYENDKLLILTKNNIDIYKKEKAE